VKLKDPPGPTVALEPPQLLGPTGLSPAQARARPEYPAGHWPATTCTEPDMVMQAALDKEAVL
jgi:hypothetical protein